jgi:hypothetical protein
MMVQRGSYNMSPLSSRSPGTRRWILDDCQLVKTEITGRGSQTELHPGMKSHFAITPFIPLDIREATLASIRGTERPPGEAKYLDSH